MLVIFMLDVSMMTVMADIPIANMIMFAQLLEHSLSALWTIRGRKLR